MMKEDSFLENKQPGSVKEKLPSLFNELHSLSNILQKNEIKLDYYRLKIQKKNEEFLNKKAEMKNLEDEVTNSFLSTVESENFFNEPEQFELFDIAERARNKKKEYQNLVNDFKKNSNNIENKQKKLKETISELPEDKHKMYLLLRDIILNDKNVNDFVNYYEISDVENGNEIIRNNTLFFKEAKTMCKQPKEKIDKLKKLYDDKRRKAINKKQNHQKFIQNIFSMKIKNSQRKYLSNNLTRKNSETTFNNNNNNTSYCSSLNNNYQLTTGNNSSTNIRNMTKTFFLRRNKALAIRNSDKIKPYFIEESNYDEHYCLRLLKNYNYNEVCLSSERKRNRRRSDSSDNSLFNERKNMRMRLKTEIFYKGMYRKQNLVGMATDSVSGIIDFTQ